MRQTHESLLLTHGRDGVFCAEPRLDGLFHEERDEVAVGRGDLLTHDDEDPIAGMVPCAQDALDPIVIGDGQVREPELDGTIDQLAWVGP